MADLAPKANQMPAEGGTLPIKGPFPMWWRFIAFQSQHWGFIGAQYGTEHV